jgi:hypothetical protein
VADLASGQAGQVAGLTVIESNRLTANEVAAFHKDAFTLAVKAPAAPRDGNGAAARAENGLPVRVYLGFDHRNGQHVSLMNTFAGTEAMTARVDGSDVVFAVRVAG